MASKAGKIDQTSMPNPCIILESVKENREKSYSWPFFFVKDRERQGSSLSDPQRQGKDRERYVGAPKKGKIRQLGLGLLCSFLRVSVVLRMTSFFLLPPSSVCNPSWGPDNALQSSHLSVKVF